MHISSFFRDLRSSYQAELDDMTFDSEGNDVLRHRLAQRRKEMDFLLTMIESNPEMVAVLFHEAFRFTRPSLMDHLLLQEADDLPPWDSLSESIEIAPWAQNLTQIALEKPEGTWFMTIAAALEYMFHKRENLHPTHIEGDEDENETADHDKHAHDGEMESDDRADPVESDDLQDEKAREEAGAQWMVDQGFDHKD
jgi:hypothetical protein